MMDYVTEDGIIKRTTLANKRDWYLLVIKELIDNAIDWLWEVYQGRDDSKIIIEIALTKDRLFKCKVRNSNPENIPVFRSKNLANIFDYEKTYGSKQNEFKIKRGAYGDASKYILALPYVLVNLGRDKSNDFEDKQWDMPLYIRHNGIEEEILLYVDEANDLIERTITTKTDIALSHTDTEVEVTYPVIEQVIPQSGYQSLGYLELDDIKNYILNNIAGTTDISFEIKIIYNLREEEEECKPSNNKVIELKQTRTHAISDDWNNLPSILRYTPQEFRMKIFGVDDKDSVTIYQILRTFREGTQLKKTADLDMPISTLVKDTGKVKRLYQMLRESRLAKKPLKKVSLPYSKIRVDASKK
jgi:hypothetical protein